MATLKDLTTISEQQEITKICIQASIAIDINIDVKDLTIEVLNTIALTLIKGEIYGSVPEGYLASHAIVVLLDRAKEKRLDIF